MVKSDSVFTSPLPDNAAVVVRIDDWDHDKSSAAKNLWNLLMDVINIYLVLHDIRLASAILLRVVLRVINVWPAA